MTSTGSKVIAISWREESRSATGSLRIRSGKTSTPGSIRCDSSNTRSKAGIPTMLAFFHRSKKHLRLQRNPKFVGQFVVFEIALVGVKVLEIEKQALIVREMRAR